MNRSVREWSVAVWSVAVWAVRGTGYCVISERTLWQIVVLSCQESVNVPRDASRLLKPTKGWMERQKAKATEGADGGGPMLQMPHK